MASVAICRARSAAIIAIAVFATAASDVNVADYSIAAIEYLPAPLEKIGKLQVGLLCLPKGKLRWRDVARPEEEVLAGRMTNLLGKAGLSVAARPDPLFGDPVPTTRYRIKIVVAVVRLRLCVAGLGIGEKQPSGDGNVTVRWETYDRALRTKAGSVAFEVPVIITQRDASGIIGDALLESARRYAATRLN